MTVASIHPSVTPVMASLITLALLAVPAAHAAPQVESETIVEVRHDLFGEAQVPAWQYLRVNEHAQDIEVMGYLGVEWWAGITRPPDLDVYTLFLRKSTAHGEWVLGRQHPIVLRRHQTLDGFRYITGDRRKVQVDAWGGIARHQDYNDLTRGAGIGRVGVLHADGRVFARGGVQTNIDLQGNTVIREDAEVRYTLGDGQRASAITGLVALAQPSLSAEWMRLEWRGWVSPTLQTAVYAQHREAPPSEVFMADAILKTLASGAVDAVGVDTFLHGKRWSRVAASYRLTSYDRDRTALWGHSFDLRYVPPRTASNIRLSPSYRFRSSPGGVFHAVYGVMDVDLGEHSSAQARGAVVSYRKGHGPWAMALDGGGGFEHEFGELAAFRISADLASDSIYRLDLRSSASLTLRTP